MKKFALMYGVSVIGTIVADSKDLAEAFLGECKLGFEVTEPGAAEDRLVDPLADPHTAEDRSDFLDNLNTEPTELELVTAGVEEYFDQMEAITDVAEPFVDRYIKMVARWTRLFLEGIRGDDYLHSELVRSTTLQLMKAGQDYETALANTELVQSK